MALACGLKHSCSTVALTVTAAGRMPDADVRGPSASLVAARRRFTKACQLALRRPSSGRHHLGWPLKLCPPHAGEAAEWQCRQRPCRVQDLRLVIARRQDHQRRSGLDPRGALMGSASNPAAPARHLLASLRCQRRPAARSCIAQITIHSNSSQRASAAADRDTGGRCSQPHGAVLSAVVCTGARAVAASALCGK